MEKCKIQEIGFSSYGEEVCTPSPINRLLAGFARDFRKKDINLSAGLISDHTIPYSALCEALPKMLADPEHYPATFNYGDPKGSVHLANAIRKLKIENNIGRLTEEILKEKEVIISSTGATGLLEGVASVLKRGIVITTDPIYYVFNDLLRRYGYHILAVPGDNEGISVEILKRKIEKLGSVKNDISFVYLPTIDNPTCNILSNERKQEVIEFVTHLSTVIGRKIPIFFDNAYEELIYDPSIVPPMSAFHYDRTDSVYELGTLSKLLAPGLRTGYIIGPRSVFIDALIQRLSDVSMCTSSVLHGIATYMLEHHGWEQIVRVRNEYWTKAFTTKAWIEEFLRDEIEEYSGGQAGFYFYITFKNVQTTKDSKFVKFLTRTTGDPAIDGPPYDKHQRVIYLLGEHCVDPEGDLVEIGRRQLRLAFGFEELEKIKQALRITKQACIYSRK